MRINTVVAIVFIFLAFGSWFLTRNGVFGIGECSGWNMINPLCWSGLLVDAAIKIVGIVLTVVFLLAAILSFATSEAGLKYVALFIVLGIIAAILVALPVDGPVGEIVAGLGSLFFGGKALTSSEESSKNETVF
jgi:hypothetical protein